MKILTLLAFLGLMLPAFRCAENYYYRKPMTTKYEGEYFSVEQLDSTRTLSIAIYHQTDTTVRYYLWNERNAKGEANNGGGGGQSGRLKIINDTVSFDRDSTFQLQFRGDSLTLKIFNITKVLQITGIPFKEGIYIRRTRVLKDSSVKANSRK